MNALLVFNDWRSGEGSIYQTELGVRLSTGHLHTRTLPPGTRALRYWGDK